MIDQNEPTNNDIEPSSPSLDSELPAIKKYKANPNRKKREASINPEYEGAILKIFYLYRRKGMNTKSAVIEHIFQNKTFIRNECDIPISDINYHLSQYKTQTENLYYYYIDSAMVDKEEEAIKELKKFTQAHRLTNKEQVGEFFHTQLTILTENIDTIMKIGKKTIEDDSDEILAIKELFKNGDITANLPARRNVAYWLDIETDNQYFSQRIKGLYKAGANRRVLEQVLINNTHFLLEISNRKNIKYLQDFIDLFNKDLKQFNIDKAEGYGTGIERLYNKLVTYNKILASYLREASNGI